MKSLPTYAQKAAQKGFTIIELLISISVTSIIMIMVITIVVFYYGDILRSQANAELAGESQAILRRMVEDVRLATSIRNTNQNADSNAPTGGWVTSNPSDIIIIANPALNSSNDIIYNPADGFPYENEFVYFVQNGSMFRRAIQNSNASGNTLRTTCPAAQESATCPRDTLMSTYVTGLSFTFYDIDNNVTASSANARSVSLTLTMQRRIYGQTIDFTNTIRTTLRNY